MEGIRLHLSYLTSYLNSNVFLSLGIILCSVVASTVNSQHGGLEGSLRVLFSVFVGFDFLPQSKDMLVSSVGESMVNCRCESVSINQPSDELAPRPGWIGRGSDRISSNG